MNHTFELNAGLVWWLLCVYRQSATFSCPSKSCCQESSGSAPRLIRLHIAGASEADTTRFELNMCACVCVCL